MRELFHTSWERMWAGLGARGEGVAARDESVMRHCLGRDIQVVGVIGGGYSKDRKALARRHGILHHSAQKVWVSSGCH